MDGHIGRRHCDYRVMSARDAAGPITARLHRLAQTQVAEILAEALDQAFGDDPTVYVLRRVKAHVVLQAEGTLPDAHLARRWGEHLAGTIVRSIANDLADSSNLIRFADQADYVAHFVADLLQGRAWQCWFYGSFAPLQGHSTRTVVRTVLLDQRAHLPAVLHYL